MNPNELEVVLRLELSANRTLTWLLDRIFNDEQAGDAIAALKQLAVQMPPENNHTLAALGFYRGMRLALQGDMGRSRRERRIQYGRYRELFELELEICRERRNEHMALSGDWSQLGRQAGNSIRLARCRAQLFAAGKLLSLRLPGVEAKSALNLCDTAAYEMFRLVYSRPSA